MSLIRNESTTLTATWFNTLAAATIVTGVLAPMAALVFGVSASAAISPAVFTIAATAWLRLGVVLHVIAKIFLRRLREMTAFEIYALFGAPLVLLLVALFVFWLTGWMDDRYAARRRGPAE
jgi:hypothetical protein